MYSIYKKAGNIYYLAGTHESFSRATEILIQAAIDNFGEEAVMFEIKDDAIPVLIEHSDISKYREINRAFAYEGFHIVYSDSILWITPYRPPKPLPSADEFINELKKKNIPFKKLKEIAISGGNPHYFYNRFVQAILGELIINYERGCQIDEMLIPRDEIIFWFLDVLEKIAEEMKDQKLKDAVRHAKAATNLHYNNAPAKELAMITINGKQYYILENPHGYEDNFTVDYYLIPANSSFSLREAAKAFKNKQLREYIKSLGGISFNDLPSLMVFGDGKVGFSERFSEIKED